MPCIAETIRLDPTDWDAFLVASLPIGPVDLLAKVGGIALDTDVNTAQFGSNNEVDDFYMVSAGVTYHFAKKKPAPVATAVAAPVVAAACTDTDGDGVCDTDDQCPTTPSGARVDSMGCLCHYSMAIEFAFDSAKLSDSDMAQLDGLVPVLTNPKVSFIGGMIEGYTDSMGSEDYNMGLSQRRADSVVKYLSSRGVNLDGRFTAKGYGEADPVASNDTKEGRAQNRRVVVRRTDCDK
jgi:OOP family OmpA-OmpF porin